MATRRTPSTIFKIAFGEITENGVGRSNHLLRCLYDWRNGPLTDYFDERALVVWFKMLNQDERHATVVGHSLEERLIGHKIGCRSANLDNQVPTS